MLLGPLAVAFLLVLADWGVWDWAIANDHGTLALCAGLAMAPLIVALAWYALLTLAELARRTIEGARSDPRPRLRPLETPAPDSRAEPPEQERMAA